MKIKFLKNGGYRVIIFGGGESPMPKGVARELNEHGVEAALVAPTGTLYR